MSTYSLEHLIYLKRLKKKKKKIILMRLYIFIIFILIWQLLSQFNIINTFIFSSPYLIFKTLFQLIKDGSIYSHLFTTLYEVFISFSLSSIIALFVSIYFFKNEAFYKIIEPYITVINSLPKVALGPLIIIWIGASTKSIIFMSLLINTFVTLINIYNSFITTDKNYIILMKSFNASKNQILRKVVIPSNYPNIISSLKINISMSLIGVIMGELLVSKKGLGYLIMYGSQVFNINLIITSVLILGLISYIMYYIIEKIEIVYKNKRS